ncbi:hypothetical protein QNN88_10260 [Citrobacter sp. ANG330]|uniref:hypothetical protein n=1 Tax=Citrobacter sp. ANG330 TaxID=3048142 RepID=UPI0039C0F863
MGELSKLIMLFLVFSFSGNALAMTCYYGNSASNVADVVTLNNIVFLKGTSNGSVVWRSDTYTRDVTCRLNPGQSGTDYVYLYPFPYRTEQQLPQGVKLGVIINGNDLGTFDNTGDPVSDRINLSWAINTASAPRTFTIQAYMVKDGDIDAAGASDKLSLFQLDGQGGLNRTGQNYNFLISGWENIGSIDCSPTIDHESFTLTGASTDQIFSGGYSKPVSAPRVSLTCTGSSSQALAAVRSISGDLSFTGNGMAGNSAAFKTSKDDLGLTLLYSGSEIAPGGKITIDVPVVDGVGSFDVPLVAKPGLSTLALNDPAWLFSEQDSSGISSNITFSFSPTLANVQ